MLEMELKDYQNPKNVWAGSVDDYWEEVKPYPHESQLYFASAFKATKYYLRTGDAGHDTGNKMPTSWVLQGSNNGEKWVELDVENQQPPWGKLEKRIFNIKNPGKYNWYRFIFTDGSDPDSIRIYQLGVLP